MTTARTCWCGNATLETFSSDYSYCPRCGTLVSRADVADSALQVGDDGADFYGKQYWLDHQREDLKNPDIFARAERDLSERCLYWLRALLRFRVPPAHVLEIGAAHGGFVALLRWAGFDATGLEVSPWVVNFARQTFDVPMRLGPIEQQDIPPASLDIIVLNDVLEHLPHPAETMAHCATLLKPDGLFVVQTPRYPEPRRYDALIASKDRFLEMMEEMSTEHLHLLSERAACRMFGAIGFAEVEFLPPLFPYDMFFIAGRQPVTEVDGARTREHLLTTAPGRLLAALLDVEGAREQTRLALAEANADRAARLAQVGELQSLFEVANADRTARLAQVGELQALFEAANVDSAARLENMRTLERLLEEANDDRAARLDQIHALTTLAQEAQRQLAERTVQLQDQTALIAERDGEVARMREPLEDAMRQCREATEQVEALTRSLVERTLEIDNLRATVADEDEQLEAINTRWDEAAAAVRAMRRSPIYRGLVRVGRWSTLDARLRTAVPDAKAEIAAEEEDETFATPRESGPPLVAIDLTPILPGGENGGAKQLVLALLDGFSTKQRHQYLLLTSERNHEDFARYEQFGMRRLCVTGGVSAQRDLTFRLRRIASRGLALAGARGRLGHEGVDLLFCPMTDPVHAEPGIPTVSIVYDLQHVAYPSFFTPVEREHRRRFFERLKQTADSIVCISEFSRSVLIEHVGVEPERVTAIPIAVHHRLPDLSPAQVEEVRRKYGIGDHPYALYPANFWAHKNHRVLFVALARFFRDHPDTSLHVVLVGSLLDQADAVREAIDTMGLTERVHVLGYVPEEDLAALWKGTFCLLFPSLYEGFGIPVLEAMRYGKPVICSGVASLPEVGGEAVRYIDPRKPGTIVEALRELLERPGYADALIEAGHERVQLFETDHMIARYLDTLDEALARGGQTQTARVDGVFGDRWLGPMVLVTTGASPQPRAWDFELNMPDWHPHRASTVRFDVNGKTIKQVRVRRGGSQAVRVPVPQSRAQMRVHVSPSFVPDVNGDRRELTVMLTRGQLVERESGTVIYEV
jgi:glycosyltransferase involved in cell wall biosynthesis/2-polyprenyl-3-methyl-5-hydroxy-6-metoxy-1,4-benzoquinol methylase